MNEHELAILRQFCLDAEPASCTPYGCGHINRTYLVATAGGRCYILQKINHHTFRDVAGLMENIELVTEHLRRKSPDPRSVLTLIRTKDGKSYLEADDGYWRVFRFVEDSICLQQPESDADFYESARAFGHFQYALRDFPAETLEETIVNFHNTPDRYRQFRAVIAADAKQRAAGVRDDIAFALEREERACVLHKMRMDGTLPVRATHNDTKINNVLFDADTRKAICVIDLDTVMPGLSAYDFGDAIRFGASTASEDEPDLSKVSLDLELFRAFTRGFLEACPSLTDAEIDALAQGAYTMTVECGIRFLGDYINGDVYFSIDRPEQNRDRARTQFRLAADMERHWDEMRDIVRAEHAVLAAQRA